MCHRECNRPDGIANMVACPVCDGVGCEACDEGYFEVTCPHRFVGDLARFINLAGMCGDNCLPVAGGLLDQSAWFLSLYQRLNSEQNRIESEKIKHGK